VMRVMQIRWTRTWAEKGGRARLAAAAHDAPASKSAELRRAARP
jgi:NNP family nitrate/nitrite transporter-like MFS transporter